MSELRHAGEKRRICWPNPDATCLEGGCMYCNDYNYRTVDSILRYCEREHTVYNRGNGLPRDPLQAFYWGYEHNWMNAESADALNNQS